MAEADFGSIMTAYNLRRIMNMVDRKELLTYLEGIFSILYSEFAHFKLFLSQINQILKLTMKNQKILNLLLNTSNSFQIISNMRF